MATRWTDEEWARVGKPVVKRAKREVLEDIARGVVPETVADFSELHDYVDANEYGGATGGWWEGCAADDEFVAFWNRVQGEVDEWLKAGRPGGPIGPMYPTGTDEAAMGGGPW